MIKHLDPSSCLLVVFAVLALASQLRTTWTWSWRYALLYLVVLATAAAGIICGAPAPFSIAGWLLIIVFVMIPSVLLSSVTSSMLALDVDRAQQWVGNLRWIMYGERYRFWRNVTEAFALYVSGAGDAGDEILSRWDLPSTPPAILEQIKSFKLTGRIILWDWPAIIGQYQQMLSHGMVPRTVLISVSRAYAELGDMAAAALCLENAKLSEYAVRPEALALTVLPFFALAGASRQVEHLLKVLSHARHGLPEFSRCYWQARCHMAQGQNELAIKSFNRALDLVSARQGTVGAQAWRKRIDHHLQGLKQTAEASHEQSSVAAIEKVWRCYQNASFVQEIIAPRKISKTVLAVVVVTSLIFAATKWTTVFGSDADLDTLKTCLSFGLLDPQKVLSGQYWRLLTYMFMHKDETHLFVNMVGLYWFGRIAQNIFGTARFIFIFFVAGIVGGVIHCLLDPQTLAIGNSGGVMGIFGAVGVGIYRLREYLPRSVRRTELSWLVGLALSGFFVDRMMPQVAGVIHGAGLAAGIIFGMLVGLPKPEYAREEEL